MSYNLPITPDKGRFLKFGSGVGSRESGVGSRESGDGEMGKWGDGEMGKWGDGEMGRWGDGEMGRWGEFSVSCTLCSHESGKRGILLWNRHLAVEPASCPLSIFSPQAGCPPHSFILIQRFSNARFFTDSRLPIPDSRLLWSCYCSITTAFNPSNLKAT